MRFLSLCSGIEAASVAWPFFKAAAFSEVAPFPCSVLSHRFPDVPNWGDMTKFEEWPDEEIDLVVGGTPCQSFSVAGLRGGLSDDRGNLALTYCRILQKYRPRWFVWENVPGVLSSNGGRDFGSILGAMAELGYGVAYRVLDAQFFGVPQRRRRVFVVGCAGDWRSAAKVLFEPGCLCGNSSKGRKARKDVAEDAGVCTSTGNISHCLNAGGMGRQDYETETMAYCIKGAAIGRKPENGPQYGEVSDKSYTLNTTEVHGISFAENSRGEIRLERGDGLRTGCLSTGGGKPGQGTPAVFTNTGVRRMTPRECERLQGFPDDWTLVPHRGKIAADGPRYKAIGNSMAVPVMRWIGERIEATSARL